MDTTYISIKILQWQSDLDKTSLTADDREEITDHLEEIISELTGFGLSDEEVWTIATKRIGSISSIQAEFEKVNPDITFRKNGLLMIYGAVLVLFLQSVFIVIPAFVFKTRHLSPVGTFTGYGNFWPLLFDILIFSLIGIILAFILRGNIITKLLSSYVLRLNVLSAMISAAIIIASGFFIIQLIDFGKMDMLHFIAPKFKTLTQFFYLGLITVLGYFLLIGNSPGIRTLLSFNRKINWKSALLLGAVACLAIIFSYTYGIPNLPLFIGCPLFGILGWMVSFSQKRVLNLFCIQFGLTLFWLSELNGFHMRMFSINHFIMLSFLLIGLFYQKAFGYLSHLLKTGPLIR
ncbi:hypothetical protein [Pedobacter sp. UBA5917]|jgi:hypothetical protein|uniref:hypothetical protein n=1 Tax=Pedobacter sp. UBA5917 TaxID=1947061 RepID=UPI0025D7B81B|nr:hypothetical protein [Pedobacter sp. UBA5917]